MLHFEDITVYAKRLCLPFETVYTSVFLLRGADGKQVLFDCATTQEDVESVILPALEELGVTPDWLVCSHSHGDHAGGLPTAAAQFPDAAIGLCEPRLLEPFSGRTTRLLQDGETVCEGITVIRLPGHAPDAIGLLDSRTGTLFSGDCLQLAGVGRYGINTPDAAAYRNSLTKLEQMPLRQIIASHDYAPLGARADTPDEVAAYLSTCRSILDALEQYTAMHPGLDAEALATQFAQDFPDQPPATAFTFQNFLCDPQ